jgi:hypothetical protein
MMDWQKKHDIGNTVATVNDHDIRTVDVPMFQVDVNGPIFATRAEAEAYALRTKEVNFDQWRLDDWRRFEKVRLRGNHDMTDSSNKRTKKATGLCGLDLDYVMRNYDALAASVKEQDAVSARWKV